MSLSSAHLDRIHNPGLRRAIEEAYAGFRANRAERALAALRIAGSRGLCLDDVPRAAAYTLRNAIAELRARGHVILDETCNEHRHRSCIKRYRLVVQPRQEALAL